MKHIHKIRIFNKVEQTFRYPDESGYFYPHHIDELLVLDNNPTWNYPYDFVFVPAVVQQCTGKKDDFGEDLYEGDLPVFEISHIKLQHLVWIKALCYDE